MIKHVPTWAGRVNSLDDIEIKLLNGLSNSCYKVNLKSHIEIDDDTIPRAFLYRKLECEVIDKETERTIFEKMSESG